MTKRHFEALAREIAASDNGPEPKRLAAMVVIRVAQADNPRFDRERFLRACGLAS